MQDASGDEHSVKKGESAESLETTSISAQANPEVANSTSPTAQHPAPPAPQGQVDTNLSQPKQAWEHVDELLQLMKTGHPLLVLTIETMVDQILQRFKASPEDEIYRLVCMLLIDAIQVSS